MTYVPGIDSKNTRYWAVGYTRIVAIAIREPQIDSKEGGRWWQDLADKEQKIKSVRGNEKASITKVREIHKYDRQVVKTKWQWKMASMKCRQRLGYEEAVKMKWWWKDGKEKYPW